MPWITRNIQVANNIFGAAAKNNYQLYVRDYSSEYSSAQLNITIAGNQFTAVSSGAEIVWQPTAGAVVPYNSMAAFLAAAGGANSNAEIGGAGRGAVQLPLPADVAWAAGQATGLLHLGAF
jgi:hypothetical protein